MSGINRIGSVPQVSRDSTAQQEVGSRRPDFDTNISGNAKTNNISEEPRNPKVMEAAKLYEKQFLREMVKAMRGTVGFSEATKPSMGEGIYRDQLDNEYVENWGDNGGVGLSELIYDQIMDRYFNSSAGHDIKKQGHIKLSDKDILRVSRVKPQEQTSGHQVPLRIEVRPSPSGEGPAKVTSPWDGKVVAKSQVDGKMALTLEHGQGLRSTLIFSGVPSAATEIGSDVKKGQSLGVLNPEIHSFFWNLRESSAGLDRGRAGL